jgi:hypothetical protein
MWSGIRPGKLTFQTLSSHSGSGVATALVFGKRSRRDPMFIGTIKRIVDLISDKEHDKEAETRIAMKRQ